jgi:predicted nuclease with TOPRIM domain
MMNDMILISFLLLGLLTAAIFLAKYKKALSNLQNNYEATKQTLSNVQNKHESLNKAYTDFRDKYGAIIDIEGKKDELNKSLSAVESEISTIKNDYQQKKEFYDSLLKQLALYEEEVEITSYGLYKPYYDFQTSDVYKQKLEEIREDEKILIKDEKAYFCGTEWTVNNNRAEGKRQTKQYGKLMLRAFNGECDALISNVRWNNVTKMEERLKKSFEIINTLGSTHRIEITQAYFDLKLAELRVTFEYEEKRQKEKEEQRRIQEQIREEEKVQREAEKAQKEAEDEEKRFKKALEQAHAELAKAQGEEVGGLTTKVQELEQQLKDALEKKERAIAQAQLTKSGNIYVISNIGSFGEDVYKIGMTRRLEPLDRIRELGDASVPFEFDVHAMIHSDNAPELEYEIHKHFEDKRINLLNNRKEFYKVYLDDIEKVVKEKRADIEFTKLAEARQFRESQAMRELASQQKESAQRKSPEESKFPESI